MSFKKYKENGINNVEKLAKAKDMLGALEDIDNGSE